MLAAPASADTPGTTGESSFALFHRPVPVPVRVEGEPAPAAEAPAPEPATAAPADPATAAGSELDDLRAQNAALQAQVAALERALAEAKRAADTLQAKLDAILTVPQPEDTTKLRVYRVREGDTLYTIAQRPEVYSDGRLWKRILEANRHQLPDPNRLQPGQQLIIPR